MLTSRRVSIFCWKYLVFLKNSATVVTTGLAASRDVSINKFIVRKDIMNKFSIFKKVLLACTLLCCVPKVKPVEPVIIVGSGAVVYSGAKAAVVGVCVVAYAVWEFFWRK